ncbi:MAG: tetratricopeptide repeat protein [bacterium]|nr:tetratricopeptide repeat protein [bacterium]
MKKAVLLISGLLLFGTHLGGCVSSPAPRETGPHLSPREREARLLLEMDRMKKQDKTQLSRLVRQAQKGGREFLVRQETESRLRSVELYRSLLEQFPDSHNDFMAEAAFRLAELLFENERERIRMVLETQGETTAIVPDFTQAIAAYRRMIESFPNHPLTEDALYGIAYCYTEQGYPDEAAEGYSRLIEAYPATRYSVEIHMRLGEYFFTMEDLQQAITHYGYVVATGEPEYVEKALYKLGWCYYNLDNYQAGIDAFFKVLDLNSGGRISADSLVNESMDIIVRSFSESGGTPGLVRRIQKRSEDSYSPLLLKKLADLYRERSFFPEAVGTYRTYVDLYPAGSDLPEVLGHLRETYHIRGDTLASLELSEALLEYVGPGTAWYVSARDERRSQIRTTILSNLETSARRRRARAQTGGREAELDTALDDLVAYERVAGPAGVPCLVRYLKGTVLTELDRFPDAPLTLNEIAEDGECGDMAQGAILASVAFQISAFEESGIVELPLFGRSVDILSGVAPENPATSRAILALGEITLNTGDLTGARSHFSRVIRDYPESEESGKARLHIARTFFKAADYRQAAAWFRESWRKSPDTGEGAEARRLHVYSLFKYAEELSEKGEFTEAAERFEAIHRQFPDSDVAQVSLYNAGKLYRNMGLERKATNLFETLAASYTESEFASEALQMSVLILEALGDPLKAAEDSMALAARSEGKEKAAALLKAAQLYSGGNDPARAASARSEYLTLYPEPVGERSRELYLLGRDLETLGMWADAKTAYLDNVQLQKDNPGEQDVTAFAARSQLRIAERSFEEYDAYHIGPPVEDTVVRKRELLQAVIREFVAAGNYRTSDVITASNFFIGRALELFKEDILASPVPPGLDQEAREEYDLLLQEMAFPFEEKALNAYRVNIKRSVTLEMLDPWIEKTYERMAELAPWAYQRDEAVAYPSTLISPPPLQLPMPAGELKTGGYKGGAVTEVRPVGERLE